MDSVQKEIKLCKSSFLNDLNLNNADDTAVMSRLVTCGHGLSWCVLDLLSERATSFTFYCVQAVT